MSTFAATGLAVEAVPDQATQRKLRRQPGTLLSWEMSQMQEFDFYINPKKPTLGLYVRKGAGLPDLADADQWELEGNVWQNELPPEILKGLEANGHAFQELGG